LHWGFCWHLWEVLLLDAKHNTHAFNFMPRNR
jgi:hypothetical protein